MKNLFFSFVPASQHQYFDPLEGRNRRALQKVDGLLPNRYEIDLLYEVLNIDFGQGAAKIRLAKDQRSKLEFEKNICRLARFEPMRPGLAESADISLELQL